MLNRSYEESYGRGYAYGKPKFRFILSHDEIMALRKYATNIEIGARIFIMDGRTTLLGHELCEQRRTPYLEAIVGIVGATK